MLNRPSECFCSSSISTQQKVISHENIIVVNDITIIHYCMIMLMIHVIRMCMCVCVCLYYCVILCDERPAAAHHHKTVETCVHVWTPSVSSSSSCCGFGCRPSKCVCVCCVLISCCDRPVYGSMLSRCRRRCWRRLSCRSQIIVVAAYIHIPYAHFMFLACVWRILFITQYYTFIMM